MLRLVHYGNALPISLPVDPSACFQAGSIMDLTLISNQVMATVSNGTAPIGIVDDVKTTSFTSISWNEVVIVAATGVSGPGGSLVTPIDIKTELVHPNIIKNSFLSTVPCVLNAINGVVTFVAGTQLNFDMTGGGTPDSIRAIVNYTYQISNIPGDDSTAGSNRVTIWYERLFLQTDQYETNQAYPLRANLFSSEVGLFTTRRPSQYHPAIAIVTAPPSPIGNSLLELLWL